MLRKQLSSAEYVTLEASRSDLLACLRRQRPNFVSTISLEQSRGRPRRIQTLSIRMIQVTDHVLRRPCSGIDSELGSTRLRGPLPGVNALRGMNTRCSGKAPYDAWKLGEARSKEIVKGLDRNISGPLNPQ